VPEAGERDEGVRELRSPAAGPVRVGWAVLSEDGVHDRPGSLDGVLTGEQRAFAAQGIAEEAFVGVFLVGLPVEQGELPLLADKLLTGALDACGERDDGVG